MDEGEPTIENCMTRATTTVTTKNTKHAKKSQYYQKLFEKSRLRARLCIDIGSDGNSDVIRLGSAIRLVRD